MKVKALVTFNDKKANKERKKGSVFNVTQERFKEINSTVHGKLVEEIKEEKEDGKDDRHNEQTNERKTEIKDN